VIAHLYVTDPFYRLHWHPPLSAGKNHLECAANAGWGVPVATLPRLEPIPPRDHRNAGAGPFPQGSFLCWSRPKDYSGLDQFGVTKARSGAGRARQAIRSRGSRAVASAGPGRAGTQAASRLGCESRSGMNADQTFRQFFRLILDLTHSCTFIVVRVSLQSSTTFHTCGETRRSQPAPPAAERTRGAGRGYGSGPRPRSCSSPSPW
jgi:hypothetical protein